MERSGIAEERIIEQDRTAEPHRTDHPYQSEPGRAQLPPGSIAASEQQSDGRALSPIEREDIRRIEVAEEDRLAFRVGVNLITLALLGFALWRLVLYLTP